MKLLILTLLSAVVVFGQASPNGIPNQTIGTASTNSATGQYAPGTITSSGTGATARAPQAKMLDIISVKDFGATGDGSTDDTTTIQNALNFAGDSSASEHGGSKVLFPKGVYIISACLKVPSGVWLEGVGAPTGNPPNVTYGSTIRLKASTSVACMIQPSDIIDGNYQTFGIENLHVDGNQGNTGTIAAGGAVIDLQNVYDLGDFHNIYINQYVGASGLVPGLRLGPGSAGIGYGPMQISNIWINPGTNADGVEIDNFYTAAGNSCGSNASTTCFAFVSGIHMYNVQTQFTGTGRPLHINGKTATIGQSGGLRDIEVIGFNANNFTSSVTACVQIDGLNSSYFLHTQCQPGVTASTYAFDISNTGGNITSSQIVIDNVTTDGTTTNYINDHINSITLAGQPIDRYVMQGAGGMLTAEYDVSIEHTLAMYGGNLMIGGPSTTRTAHQYANSNGWVLGSTISGTPTDLMAITPFGVNFYDIANGGAFGKIESSGNDTYFESSAGAGNWHFQLGTGIVDTNTAFESPAFVNTGTAPTTTGSTCGTIGTQTGGNTGGTIVTAAVTTCTLKLNFALTAPHGWNCWFGDRTNSHTIFEATSNTTSCTSNAATITAADTLYFNAFAY